MKLGIIVCVFLICSPAFASRAQEASPPASPPTVDEQLAQCGLQSAQSQAAFWQTRLQLLAAQKQIASFQKELADKTKAPSPKP